MLDTKYSDFNSSFVIPFSTSFWAHRSLKLPTTRSTTNKACDCRPVAGLCSEGFGFRFLVIQNECPEGTSYPRGSGGMLPGKLLKVRCSEMKSGAFWVIKSVEML